MCKRQPYKALAVANYFLGKSNEIDPLKIQKLLYYAQGWYLAYFGNPLFGDKIAVWPYGPVIPDVYHEFKKYGNNPIEEPGTDLDFDSWEITVPQIDSDDKDAQKLLDAVWDKYGKQYTSIQLSQATHRRGTPWDEAKRKDEPEISVEAMKRHFEAKKEQAA